METYKSTAENLCSQMTLREKIGQIAQISAGYNCYTKVADGIEFTEDFKKTVETYGGIGAISGLLRSDPWTRRGYGSGIEIEQREKCANYLQKYLMDNTRLGIPALIEVEASHGLQSLGSVMYPLNICSGSSFNPDLYEKVMEQIGREIALSGNHIAFTTVIDIARDPRWGRTEECFGEDPYHASRFAEKAVTGLKNGGALACAKHFCAAGKCDGGLNSANISVGENEIREFYLPTAKAAIDAGADLIMIAYNTVDGIPCHTNRHLLQDILRKELGFDGIIISDGTGLARLTNQLGITKEKAAVLGLKTGIDLSLADVGVFELLEHAVGSGAVSEKAIDAACTRVLRKKFELGLIGKDKSKVFLPEGQTARFVNDGHCDELAYKMAAESVVMLKNNDVLPLEKSKKLCLIGENLDGIYYLLGDYTSERKADEGATLCKAFKERKINFTYKTGWSFSDGTKNLDDALKAAADCDAVILGMGGSSVRDFNAKYLDNGAVASSNVFMDCGEGCDTASLDLPEYQITALKKLKKLGKTVIALLIEGRPYSIPEVSELADAVLVGWYAGQQGARAIADIIFGDVNPSGKLPVSVPASSGCLPVCYNHFRQYSKYVNAEKPVLYPFGFGLSYSKFEYSNITSKTIDNKSVAVEFDLENVSETAGSETAQLYVHLEDGLCSHPVRELKKFKKVLLAPHEKIHIEFDIKKDDLYYTNKSILEEAEDISVEIYVGGDSDCTLKTTAVIKK